MQFLDIYQQDELFLRIPLGETDLMESSTHCEQDVVFRQRIVKVMIRRIKRSVESIGIKRAEYYLVFESKMNLLASEGATIEHPCDAPFITCDSIEQ